MTPESRKINQKEKRMYPALKEYLEKNGWNLVLTADGKKKGPFKIWLNGNSYSIDVVAFRFGNYDRIESMAIECKYGESSETVAQALPQAIKYQIAFPKVFIATNAGEIGYMGDVLDKLKIGYFEIRGDEVKLHENKDASMGLFFKENEFKSQVQNWGLLLLSYKEAMGEFYFGQDEEGIYVTNKPSGVLQYTVWGEKPEKTEQGQCNAWEKTEFYFGIFAMRKKTVSNIAASINVKDLFELLKKLPKPEEYYIEITKKRYPYYKNESEKLESLESSIKELTLKKLESYIQKLKEWAKKSGMTGKIAIYKKIWDDWAGLSRKNAVDEIKKTQKELSDLYNLLSSNEQLCAK